MDALLFEFGGLGYGHGVTALVLLVACVALYPVVVKGVPLAQGQQLRPQVAVQGGLFVCLYPPALLPAFGPALGKAVYCLLYTSPSPRDA